MPNQKRLTPSTLWTPGRPLGANTPSLWLRPDADLVTTGGSRDFEVDSTQFFSIVDNASLSSGDIDLTIAAWVKLESTGADRYIVSKWGGSTNEFGLFWDDSESCFAFQFGTGTVLSTVVTPVVAHWYFVVAEHDAANDVLRIWVNQSTPDNIAYSSGCTDGDSTFEIGGAAGASTWDGLIARAAMWKRTLTAAERTFLYNSGQGQAYGDIGVAGTDGSDLKTSLVSWWNLNEASGNAIDQHGTNDLTDNNTVTAAAGITTRARQYTAATTEYHSVADNADLSSGDIDFFIHTHVYLNDLTLSRTICSKSENVAAAATFEWYVAYSLAASGFRFRVSDGTNMTNADYSIDIVAGQWFSVLVWHDKVSNTINIRVDDNAVVSVAHTTGCRDGLGAFEVGRAGISGSHMNGRIGRTVFAKPPTAIADLIDDIHEHFYADGDGNDHTQLTEAQRAAWGVVSMWDGDEVSGALLDKVGARARDFEATNTECLQIPHNVLLRPGDSDFSLSVWYKPESTPAEIHLIAKWGNTADHREYRIFADATGKPAFSVTADGTYGTATTVTWGSALTPGTWYFIYAQHDSAANTIKISVNDGAFVSAAHAGGVFAGGTAIFFIGARDAVPTAPADGLMCRAGFWAKCLSDAEITALYNSGAGLLHRELEAAESSLLTSLVAYWDLDEFSSGAGAVNAIDRSRNALHLTDTDTVTSGPGPGPTPAYDMADNNTVTVAVGPGTELGAIADQDTVQQLLSRDASALAFTQETAAKKPAWNERSALLALRPTLSFDGVDDLLRYAGELTTAAAGALFIVYRRGAIGAEHELLSSCDEASDVRGILFGLDGVGDDHEYEQVNNDVSDQLSSGTAVGTAAAQIIAWTSTGAAGGVALRVFAAADALAVDAGGNNGDWFGDASARDNVVLGAMKFLSGEQSHFEGEIAEVLLYDAALNLTQIKTVERYLSRRYKIPLLG